MKTYTDMNTKISTLLESLSVIVTSNLVNRVQMMQTSGMSTTEIKKILLTDLVTGGRIFGQLRNGVKRISKNAIEEVGNIATYQKFLSANYKEYKWITVGKNICPDCKDRHGEVGDIKFFTAIGLPKSGFSVCEDNCNCQLVPVQYKGEDLSDPIKFVRSSESSRS
tara:strand:+ start:54 stop:551 length:498 start_codon:yes stop_codon:yes gene_type:complete